MTKKEIKALAQYVNEAYMAHCSQEEKKNFESTLASHLEYAKKHGINSKYAFAVKAIVQELRQDAREDKTAKQWLDRIMQAIA